MPISKKRDRDSEPAVSEQLLPTPHPELFPVVAVGGSAGGLEAFAQLLVSKLPADTGMAFVMVLHLAPTHASCRGGHPVPDDRECPSGTPRNGRRVEADHIYVMPPGPT